MMKSPSELRKCELRKCSKCKKHKPTGDFYLKAESNRLSSRCKSCQDRDDNKRRAALRQNDKHRDHLMAILRRHGALPGPDLAEAAGMPARHVCQVMKPLTQLGQAVLIRRWGTNGQSLYALPGQAIPERRELVQADPQVRAAIDAEHDAWFASLASSVAERAARNVMRGRV